MIYTNNEKGWTSKRLEKLASEIHKWLRSHDMWIDTYIYYDGKCMCTEGKLNGETVFRYNEAPFIREDSYPTFEYVADPHILSMSFEGPLYEVLNYGPWNLAEEFQKIFEKYGLYYELGNAWNLTCYKA